MEHAREHGFLWIDRDGFAQVFAVDANPVEARVMAAAQKPLSIKSFTEKSVPPAWKHVPSWPLVSVRTVAASHASMVSHPKEVADMIVSAATTVAAASAGAR
jgi:hypothetical protein